MFYYGNKLNEQDFSSALSLKKKKILKLHFQIKLITSNLIACQNRDQYFLKGKQQNPELNNVKFTISSI